ncbi:MAG: hypothetical protein ACRDE5_03100, partial [Ginsengibacter sp.]
MTVTGAGNVGIGAASPFASLHVLGKDAKAGTGTISDDGAGNITGTGTAFTTELHVGDVVYLSGDPTTTAVITVITDDTDMTIDNTFGIASDYDFFYQQPISKFVKSDGTTPVLNVSSNGTVVVGGAGVKSNLEISGAGGGLSLSSPANIIIASDDGGPYALALRRTDLGPKFDVAIYNAGDSTGGDFSFAVGDGAGSSIYPLELKKDKVLLLASTSGNVGIGMSSSPTALLQVAQFTTGIGTVSNGAGGTTVTGVGTQFLNTFKIGDTITIGGETKAISAIASNTSMTTAAFTGANSGVAYTLTGGTRFSVLGNGNVGIGTTSPSQLLTLASTGSAAWDNGSGTADTGISRGAAGVVAFGNGTAGNASGELAFNSWSPNASGAAPYAAWSSGSLYIRAGSQYDLGVKSGAVQVNGGDVFGWGTGDPSSGSADTGFSRVSAGVIGVGTGAAGSTAGTLSAAGVTLTSANTTQTTTSSALVLNANSLNTGTGIYAASSTLTTGKLVDLQVSGTAADNNQTALNILTTGANASSSKTTYGAQIANTHSGTGAVNVGLYATASGG